MRSIVPCHYESMRPKEQNIKCITLGLSLSLPEKVSRRVLINNIRSEVKVAQSCPTLWPRGLYRGILQARIVEWIAIPFSRGSSWPRDQTQASHITGAFFTSWAKREALLVIIYLKLITRSSTGFRIDYLLSDKVHIITIIILKCI